MSKQFTRYFGKNIASIIYIIGIALVIAGGLIAVLYWVGYGLPLVGIGVIIYIVTAAMKVSGNDLDARVEETAAGYALEHLKEIKLGKKQLDPASFSVFSGYYYDSPKTPFKSGRDGKVRTATYFVTAISEAENAVTIAFSLYSLTGAFEPTYDLFPANGETLISLSSEMTDFPCRIQRCAARLALSDGSEREEQFYLPDDAIADAIIQRIKDR